MTLLNRYATTTRDGRQVVTFYGRDDDQIFECEGGEYAGPPLLLRASSHVDSAGYWSLDLGPVSEPGVELHDHGSACLQRCEFQERLASGASEG